MNYNRQNIFQATATKKTVVWDAGLRSYMLKIYNYMATGVLLTGIIALLSFKLSVETGSNGAITGFTPMGEALFFSGLKWVVMLAPLGVVFYMLWYKQNEFSKSANSVLDFCSIDGIIVILDIACLYGCKRS